MTGQIHWSVLLRRLGGRGQSERKMRIVYLIVSLTVMASGFMVCSKPLTLPQVELLGLMMAFYFFGIITGWYNK